MVSNLRIIFIVFFFGLTFAALYVSGSVKETPIKKPLSQFPEQIGTWSLAEKNSFSDSVTMMIGADDYFDYHYVSPDRPAMNLYVSYFGVLGKRGGYHSPKNCLPGSGWNITKAEVLELDVPLSAKGSVRVNLITVQKGTQKQVVIYWYKERGRIVASEYLGKIYLVTDSIFKRRRDASFIRIMSSSSEDTLIETAAYMQGFAEQVMIILEAFLPGC